MNTLVNFEIAKLLKSKGFKAKADTYNVPTMSEAIVWLYENHGIWVSVMPYNDEELSQTLWEHTIINIDDDYNDCSDYTFYHSPTEAYEAAILYCLTELI